MTTKAGRKKLIKCIAVLLAVASSVLAGCNPSFAVDIPPIPNGTAAGTTFTVKDTITSWYQLEGLVGPYKTISLGKQAHICTNNFSEYFHLGELSGTDPIARISVMGPGTLWPPRILSEYNTETHTFRPSRASKGSTPSYITGYKWKGSPVYVYDSSRNNCVGIDHGVVDETGLVLLPYSNTSVSTFDRDAADMVNNIVYVNGLNAPVSGGTVARVHYDGVMHGPTIAYTYNFSYYYTLTPVFYSTVKVDADALVLGRVLISELDEEEEAVCGARFRIYSDANCEIEAKHYSSGSWSDVGELVTGEDGSVLAENLRPGTYYVRQTGAAEGYETDETVRPVSVALYEPDLSLDASSAEGTGLTITPEQLMLEPPWEQNAYATEIPFDESAYLTETAAASSYNSGGELFIKAGGNHVVFNEPDDVDRLESLTLLNEASVNVTAGSISESFDTLNDALDYVNGTLIDSAMLDDVSVQDHVTISTDSEMVFEDASNQGSAGFAAAKIPEEDVPVTGVERKRFPIPILIAAAIGLGLIMLL